MNSVTMWLVFATGKKLSYESYQQLLATMKKAKITAKVIYLFSAKKFDDRLVELAKDNPQIVLVDMTEL